MSVDRRLRDYISREVPVVCATIIAGPDAVGTKLLIKPDGSVEGGFQGESLLRQLVPDAVASLERESSETRSYVADGGTYEVFIDAFPAPQQIIIVGATHTAIALTTMARLLGYRTIVVDARAAFAREDRFPHADRVIKAWPQDAFTRLRLDRSTYVVLLSHDPKFDDPTLQIALPSDVIYVGAIGSRKTQQSRRERLRAEGFGDEALAKLYGPIGLALGGRSAEEIALAVIAEITAVRHGAPAAHLRDRAAGPAATRS